MDAIREEIKKSYQEFENITEMDEMWSNFMEMTKKLMRKHVPTKFTRARPFHPWINTDLNRLTRRENRAHKKAKKTQCKLDWVWYQRLTSTSQREIRLARENYLQEVLCEDSKRFWSYIKHQKQDSNAVSALKGPDGLLHSDTPSKAEILNNQFHSVYTKENLSNIPSKGDNPHPLMDNIHVGVNGVCKLLKGLNAHKATRPDAVPTRFLHDFAVELQS